MIATLNIRFFSLRRLIFGLCYHLYSSSGFFRVLMNKSDRFIPRKLTSYFKKDLPAFFECNRIPPEQNQRLLREANNYWDEGRIKKNIDTLNSGHYADRNFHGSLPLSAPEIGQFQTILDFGAGIGTHAHRLHELYPGKEFYCYDISYVASPSLFRALQGRPPPPQIRYIQDFEGILPRINLVYSSLVFSLLPPKQLIRLLALFKKHGIPVLMTSNSLIKQKDWGTVSKPRNYRDLTFDHNYPLIFQKAGYRVEWSYQLASMHAADKKVICLFAK